MFSHKLCLLLPFAVCAAWHRIPAHVELVKVESHSASRTIPLTAELMPYLQTDIEARVPGYVEKVLVDRGSVVHRGQLLVQLSAPEMRSETNASESALHQAEADEAQAGAQAAAAASTYARLARGCQDPGGSCRERTGAGRKAKGCGGFTAAKPNGGGALGKGQNGGGGRYGIVPAGERLPLMARLRIALCIRA